MLSLTLCMILFGVLLVQIVALTGRDGTEPCCVSCTVPGEEKYYSIDDRHNNCGECCMRPEDYDLYKKFEKGLEKANSTTPCADLHFLTYTETVIMYYNTMSQLTMDLYDHVVIH